MKVTSLSCPNCGAPIDTDSPTEVRFCTYCGQALSLSDVQKVKLDDAQQMGYEFEKGRMRAQQEAQRNTGSANYQTRTVGSYQDAGYQAPQVRAAFTRNKHIFVWLWSFYLGWLGADRFARGQVGLGVVKLLTGGGFMFWWLADFVIALNKAYLSGNTTSRLYFDDFGNYAA